MFFKSKSRINCYVFHFGDEIQDVQQLVSFFYHYFLYEQDVRLRSFFSFDPVYQDHQVEMKNILRLEDQDRWRNMERVIMTTEAQLDKTKTLLINYNIRKPVEVLVALARRYAFDMEDFAKELYKRNPFFYAYRYSCSSFRSVTAYPSGGIENRKQITDLPSSRLTEKIIGRWRKNLKDVRKGLLRDVYREAILTSRQLESSAGNRSLRQAIQNDQLGRIKEIGKDLYYWKIEDEVLKKARKRLYGYEIFV